MGSARLWCATSRRDRGSAGDRLDRDRGVRCRRGLQVLWARAEDAPPGAIPVPEPAKYPASHLFLLMTLGPTIALLAVAERSRGWVAEVLETFGRVPMFYYLLHIPLIHATAPSSGSCATAVPSGMVRNRAVRVDTSAIGGGFHSCISCSSLSSQYSTSRAGGSRGSRLKARQLAQLRVGGER